MGFLDSLGSAIGGAFSNLGSSVNNAQQAIGQDFSNFGSAVQDDVVHPLQQDFQDFTNGAGQYANTLQNNLSQDFNSFLSNGGQDFSNFGTNLNQAANNGGNEVMNMLANVQQGIDNAQTNQPFQVNLDAWRNSPFISNINNSINSLPVIGGINQFGQNFSNIPGVEGLASGFLNAPGQFLQGISRFGGDIAGSIGANGVGVNQNPNLQNYLGDIAQTAQLPLMFTGLGEGAGALDAGLQGGLRDAITNGFLTGAKVGGAYGGLQGLSDNRDATDLQSQLTGAVPSALTGALLGGLTGGISPVVARTIRDFPELFNDPQIKEILNGEQGFIKLGKTPQERLEQVLTWPQQLIDRGYSADQVDLMSPKEAYNIIENNIKPEDWQSLNQSVNTNQNPASTSLKNAPISPQDSAGDNFISQVKNSLSTSNLPDEIKGTVQDALAKRFEVLQNVSQRENLLQNSVSQGVKDKVETRLFRDTIEHPDHLEANMKLVQNPEAFSRAVQSFRDYTDYVYQQLKGNKADPGYFNNYYTHILDLTNPEDAAKYQEFMQNKLNNYRGYFTNSRIFKNIDELEAAGLKLKNMSPQEDISQYTSAVQKNLGNKILINELNRGYPNAAIEFGKAGEVPRTYDGRPYVQSQIPGSEGTFLDPQVYQGIKHLGPNVFADNKIMQAADTVNTGMKQLRLGGGLFHAVKETLNYTGNELANFRIPHVFQAARLFFSPKAMLEYKQSAIESGLIDKASKMGVTLGKVSDLGRFNTDDLTKIGERNPLSLMHQATFDRLLNFYKLETVRATKVDGLSDVDARKVGAQINNLFGGLNYDLLQRDKGAQQLLRMAVLAPDFSEGKLRLTGTALTPGPAGNFARKAIIGTALSTAIEVELARRLMSGNFDDLKGFVTNAVLDPNVQLPYKSPSGKNLVAGVPGSNVADIFHLFQDPGHFITARGSALAGLITQLKTGQDYYGDPTSIGNLIQSNLPIPAVQLIKTLQGKQSPTTALLNTAGLRVHTDPNDPSVKYFASLNEASNKLSGHEKGLFDTVLHPQTKDQDGNILVQKGPYTKAEQYTALLDNPKLLAAEQAFQQSQPNHDPMWDLTADQLKAELQAKQIQAVDPSGDKATVNALKSTLPSNFSQLETQYYNNLQAQGVNLPPNPFYVQTPQNVQDFWTAYHQPGLTPDQKHLMLSTPTGQQAIQLMAQQQNLTNQQRLEMGLPLLATTSSSGGFSGSHLGGNSALKLKSPKLSLGKGLGKVKVGSLKSGGFSSSGQRVKLGSVRAIKPPALPKSSTFKLAAPKLTPVRSTKSLGSQFSKLSGTNTGPQVTSFGHRFPRGFTQSAPLGKLAVKGLNTSNTLTRPQVEKLSIQKLLSSYI